MHIVYVSTFYTHLKSKVDSLNQTPPPSYVTIKTTEDFG